MDQLVTLKSIHTKTYEIALVETGLSYQVVSQTGLEMVQINTFKDLNMALYMFETKLNEIVGQ